MPYIKTIWKNRLVEKPRTFRQQQNTDGTVTLLPVEGQIFEPGTPVSAENLQKIEDELVAQERTLNQYKEQSASTVHGPVRKEYILFQGALTSGEVTLTMPLGFSNLNDFDEVIVLGTMDTTSPATWKHFNQYIDTRNENDIIGFAEFHENQFAGSTYVSNFWLRGELNRSTKKLSITYNRRKLGAENAEDTYVNAIGGVVGVKYD